MYASSLFLTRSWARTVLVGGGDCWMMVMGTELASKGGGRMDNEEEYRWMQRYRCGEAV